MPKQPELLKHYVNQSEYGRIRGVSQPTVNEAIRNGRIKTHLVNGKKLIDVEEANRDWEANTDGAQMRGPLSEDRNQAPARKGYPSFQESRAIREAYSARITKLEYEEKLTKLVELDRIKEINFDVARQVRNAVLNVPGTINAEVAVETDPHKVEILIYNALAEALENATKEK
jgi:hypothetical protein